MKDILTKVSILNRTNLQEIKDILKLTRLLSLIEFMDGTDEKGSSSIEIPTMGKILISKDLDFEFIPSLELKKEIIGIKQNPNNFLKTELKKLFEVGENNG